MSISQAFKTDVMPQALKTDVSILSLAYGQRARHTPTARVVEPSSGVAPAQGKGNLYILIEVEGEDEGRPRLYRDLLTLITETYYYSDDDIVAALTQSLRAMHGYLLEYSDSYGARYTGGATCLVATGSEVISAQAGPTILAVRSNAGLQWFSPLNEEHFSALGESVMPAVEIGQVQGHPGVIIVGMNSAWASYMDVQPMMEATSIPRAQVVADQLAGIGIRAPEDLTLLVVTLMDEEGLALADAEVASAAAVAAATPSIVIPEQQPIPETGNGDVQSWEETSTIDEQPVSAAKTPEIDIRDASKKIGAAFTGLGLSMRTATASKKPKKKETTKKPSRRIPFVLAIVAILALAVVVVAAGTWYFQGQQRTQYFAKYMNGVQVNYNAAMSSTDENQARLYLQAAEEQLEQAAQFAPEHPDVLMWRNRLAEAAASINHVVPLLSGFDVPLLSFDEMDRRPSAVFVNGLGVYLLDSGRGTLERYQLDEATGDRLADDGTPQLLLQTGTTVGGRRVGELANAVWAPAQGNRTASGPLVLDRSNQLFSISEGLGPSNVTLAENPELGLPAAMEYYSGNLYLLDTTDSQLWRYRPNGESYNLDPEPYFSGEDSVNLSSIVDTAIDGAVWLLHPNGTVLKYFGGVQEAFALDIVDPEFSDAVTLWANDADPPGGHLYIVDAASNRILVFDKSGNLLSQLMPEDQPGILNNLQDIFIDEVSNYMYILTNEALYQVTLPPLRAAGESAEEAAPLQTGS